MTERRSYVASVMGIATTIFVVLPFFTEWQVLLRTSRLALAGILIYAVWRLASSRLIPWIVIAVAAVDVAAQWVLAGQVVPAWIVARHIMALAFLVTAASYLTAAVWRDAAVSIQTLLIAVGLYFLLGLFWTTVFGLTEFLHPGSFELLCEPQPGEPGCVEAIAQYPRLRYFSFVTMTTLGYGDVVPQTRAAEGWTTMASVTGQLFIAILIGRVVGSYMSRGRGGGYLPTA